MWFGLFDGITDWVYLPYIGAKKQGAKGFFKGLAKGFGSLLFKPAAGMSMSAPLPACTIMLTTQGTIGFATHPFFGIYKEAAKFKVSVKRKQKPRQDVGSLI